MEPKFLDKANQAVTVQAWLGVWSEKYHRDEAEYAELIAKQGPYSAADFEMIGQWKDAAINEAGVIPGKWKPNVASVAYAIWMQAASELPEAPKSQQELFEFLRGWAGRKYTDTYKTGKSVEKCFGLSRASTLLHFVSRGRYPIFDSRVRTAITHLTSRRLEYNIEEYLRTVCPFVWKIQQECNASPRRVDNALFEYGAWVSEKKRKKRSAPRDKNTS